MSSDFKWFEILGAAANAGWLARSEIERRLLQLTTCHLSIVIDQWPSAAFQSCSRCPRACLLTESCAARRESRDDGREGWADARLGSIVHSRVPGHGLQSDLHVTIADVIFSG